MSSSNNPAIVKFNCATCGKLLQVPSDLAGKPVRCPSCSRTQTVPAASPTPPVDNPQATPMPAHPATPAVNPAGQAANMALGAAAQAVGQAGNQPAFTPATPADAGNAVPSATAGTAAAMPNQQTIAQAPATFTKPTGLTKTPRLSIDQTLEQGSAETQTKKLFDRILGEVGKIYVGQDEVVLGTLVALFSNGHVLIESVPGLGKTLFVRTLGKALGCQFGRIQFTADLMPSDITGAPIFDMKTQEFRFRPGPVFTQLLLADEINRSPAKTHAALLETMQEYRVTIDGVSHELERPFIVLATQNPIESEGTYNLPEAQLDRFMFKLIANYPMEAEEAEILQMHSKQVDINDRLKNDLETVTSPSEIMATIRGNSDVRIDDKLVHYINQIVRKTREWPGLHMGASPRAGIALMQGARTLAAFNGRDYAVPDDVAQLTLPALRHRVILSAEAEVEGQNVDDLLTGLVQSIEVPRL